MVVVTCSVPSCEFRSNDVSEPLAIAILANPGLAHQPQGGTTTVAPANQPKLERPRVDLGITTEEWNVFVRRWEVFKTGCGIDDSSAPSQLFQCASTELGDSMLKANAKVTSGSLKDMLEAMKALAVIPVAVAVLRSELLRLRQERTGEGCGAGASVWLWRCRALKYTVMQDLSIFSKSRSGPRLHKHGIE